MRSWTEGPVWTRLVGAFTLTAGALFVLAASAVGAGDPGEVPPGIHANPRPTDEPNSLPIYMTPEELERIDEIGIGHRATDPPPQVPRNCAEWEPLQGVIIRYPLGIPYALVRDYADHMILYCLVSSGYYNQAYNNFVNNGVNMDNVEFLIMPTNSIWVRDYGPWFVFDGNGEQAIIDHIYNRPRPDDDQVNWNLGNIWSMDVYGHDLEHTGGNYMTDGHGISFSTDLVWDENPGYSHAEIAAIMEAYLGIRTYHVVPDISPTGIHHIDCWAKLLDEETILVKQVAEGHADYQECEENAAYLASLTNCYGRNYKIVRVFCPSIGGGGVAAYTNSLILNNRVYVPLFGTSYDDDAMAVYEAAMPGYEVLGFTGSWYSDDAIHCRGKGIMDRYMLYVDHNPLQDRAWDRGPYRVVAFIDDRSEMGLVSDSLLVHWRLEGQMIWNEIAMTVTADPDSFEAEIPEQPAGSTIEYYVSAVDYSDRHTQRPWVAPAGYYSFEVTGTIGVADAAPVATPIQLAPNPFNPTTSLRFDLRSAGLVSVAVYGTDGRLVKRLVAAPLTAGAHVVSWDGTTAEGDAAASGLYLFRIENGGEAEFVRGVLVK